MNFCWRFLRLSVFWREKECYRVEKKNSRNSKFSRAQLSCILSLSFHMSHFKKNPWETDYQPKMGHPGGSPSKTNGQSMEEMTALRVLFWSRESENAKTIASILLPIANSAMVEKVGFGVRPRALSSSGFIAINQIQHRLKQLLLLVPPSYYVTEI